jgi:hypothetical protein
MDSDLPKTVRVALNEAANSVVDEAKPRVPKRRGRARASVKAKSTRTLVRVSGGGPKAPYYPWLDFGGRVGRNRSIRRDYKPKGRYIYKAYFRQRDSGEFQEILSDALGDVARRAGLRLD